MFKSIILLAVVALGVASALQDEATPEPYAYQYDAGSHAQAETKDASGKVTGYYTLADADGRQRRVDYEADGTGFHAKVQTNEVGTKTENSADVEVLASPPTREQLVQTQVVGQQQPQQQQLVQQVVQQPQQVARVYNQQVLASPQYQRGSVYGGYQSVPVSSGQYLSSGYGYYPGAYGYGAGYGAGYGSGYGSYGAYNGLNNNAYYGYSGYPYGSNYRTVAYNANQVVPAAQYSTVRSVQSTLAAVPTTTTTGTNYRVSGYQTVPVGGVNSLLVNGQRVGQSYQYVQPSSTGYYTQAVQQPAIATSSLAYN